MSFERHLEETRQRPAQLYNEPDGLSHDDESPAAGYYEKHRLEKLARMNAAAKNERRRTGPFGEEGRLSFSRRITNYDPGENMRNGDAGKRVLVVIGLDTEEDSKRAMQQGAPRSNVVILGKIMSPKR